VRTLLMLGFTMLVVVQWSDLNSAFSFLSSIEVWQVSSKVAGIEQLSAITLQDLMLTVFAFILTVVTARNLPGLMELTLLQHLSLSPGTGFALTTVSKYLVLLIGALTGFSMLGIDWSKTQWLVAALSVGWASACRRSSPTSSPASSSCSKNRSAWATPSPSGISPAPSPRSRPAPPP
jgi:potassium efflux system protein